MLKEEQQKIFDRISNDRKGSSFVIIGKGGVGKTFLLKILEEHFRKDPGNKVIFINLEQFAAVDFKEGLQPFLARELGVENSFDAIRYFLEKNGHNVIIFMDELNQLDKKYEGFFRSFTQGLGVRYVTAARDISAMKDRGSVSEFTNVMVHIHLN